MKLTQQEKYEIAKKAAEILEKKHKKVSRSWIALRKEIRSYCENEIESHKNVRNIRWVTLQSEIYDTIRACLNISRLDNMTDRQAVRARAAFNFIKQERELTNDERVN